MKPPMNDKITLYQTVLDEQNNPVKDPYGRPQTKPVKSKARVMYSTQVVQGTDGRQYETSLEVDLPADIFVNYGDELEYTPFLGLGVKTKGLVRAMSESTSLAGNKVYFRTVYVG